MMKYLERYYSNISEKDQKSKMEEILERLKDMNFLDSDTLQEVVHSLLNEESWPFEKVLAHLDMIDLDERT